LKKLRNRPNWVSLIAIPNSKLLDYSPYKHLINEEYKNAIKGYRILLVVDNAFRACDLGGGEETEETRGGEADEEDDQDEEDAKMKRIAKRMTEPFFC